MDANAERVRDRLVTVEKRKWDDTVSAREPARLLEDDGEIVRWWVSAGARRERPRLDRVERVERDELWLGLRSDHAVLCCHLSPAHTVERFELHAACPPVVRESDRLDWIDLDLDVELADGCVEMLDEGAFVEHAAEMRYPDDVVTAAWAGIAALTPRFVNGQWPFDGSLDAYARRHAESVPRPHAAGRGSASTPGR